MIRAALIVVMLSLGFGSVGAQNPEFPLYGKWQEATQPPISFHLEQSWGDDENGDYFIRWVHSFAVDVSGNLYVLDSRNDHLQSLASDGTLRWEIDAVGEGPGELSDTRGIAYDGQGMLNMGNQAGYRIDRFDTDGNYIDSHSTDEFEANWLKVGGFLRDGKLVLSSNELGKYAAWVVVVNVSDSWSMSAKYLIDQSYRDDLPEIANAPPGVNVFRESVANGNVANYSIEVRDPSGEIVHEFGRPVEQAVGPGYYNHGRSHSQLRYFATTGPYALKDGYFLVEGYWPKKKINPDEALKTNIDLKGKNKPIPMMSTIDLYDRRNQLLYSIESDEKTHGPFKQNVAVEIFLTDINRKD